MVKSCYTYKVNSEILPLIQTLDSEFEEGRMVASSVEFPCCFSAGSNKVRFSEFHHGSCQVALCALEHDRHRGGC